MCDTKPGSYDWYNNIWYQCLKMEILTYVWILLFATNCECSRFVNLVLDQRLRGNATMSVDPLYDNVASNAIDGDTGAHKPCAAMDVSSGYTSVWWKVWMQKTFNVAEIKIYFQPSTIYRSTGFSIYVYDTESYIPPSNVSGELVYQHDPATGCPPQSMTIRINRITRGIAFYNTRERALHSTCTDKSPEHTVVEICEVNVLGCDAIRYSENCSLKCDERCLNQQCDAYNGDCIHGCRDPHHAGPHCTVCDDNHYSSDCSKSCGHCKNGERCHNITGRCSNGCQPNWQSPLCQVCDNKHYLSDCSGSCGHCANDERCHMISGNCTNGCQPNWQVPLCQVCDDNHYSSDCSKPCGHCKNERCHNITGYCVGGCVSNWQEPLCQVCDNNHYLSDCSGVCGHCKNGERCHNITGNCNSGCQTNWHEPLCQVCRNGFYDSNCSQLCGHCKTGTYCDKVTGDCPSGCQDHWGGSKCDECDDKHYLNNCSGLCGHCKNKERCNNMTGHCMNGCQRNWKEPLCKECKDGFYNSNCSKPCGHCKTGTVCDKVTGICPNGCQDHWTGSKCDECDINHYSSDCSRLCGHCKNGERCHNITGHCNNGCKPNWQEPLCQECDNSHYSSDCSGVCGHCKNEERCHNITGQCKNGCQPNWQEPMCQVCKDGFYNSNCSEQCGHCKTGTLCDKETGICEKGCEDHWTGSKCDVCKDGFYDSVCSKSCGHCTRGTYCDKETGVCHNGCQDHWNGSMCDECDEKHYSNDCNKLCGHCKNGERCHNITGNCTHGCQSNFMEPLCQVLAQQVSKDDSQTPIIGGSVAAVLVLLISGAVLIIIIRRRKSKSDSATDRKDTQQFTFKKGLNKSRANQYANISETQSEVSFNATEIQESEGGGYYNTIQSNTNIRIEDLQDVILRKSDGENNIFLEEYKKFPAGNVNICQTAKKSENVVKNRFKTTFPYEHSRVILNEKWSESENDYINANFIKDCNGAKIYIAAQGPKNNTLNDFWRMIWGENIETIVMLTNVIENGKNKCTRYWPEKGKTLDVGPCKVTLVKETAYSFHTVRTLSVQRKNSPVKRRISQFHYTAWPDHGTPEELGLVQFHSAVTKTCVPPALCLVHCSAGVGRTGTYIALDALLKQGRETKGINVFEFVKQMREDRMTMVQTPEQYIFLHKALLCGFQDRNTLVPESDFLAKTNKLLNDTSPLNQRDLYEEFKFLVELQSGHKNNNEEAGKPENKKKNLNMDILPVPKYQPFLTTYVKGRNDYINAVMVPSFTTPTGFIMTQKPPSGCEVDLWRLCMDHEADAIVVLNDNTEENKWLPKRGSSQPCPPFTLTSGDTGSDMNGVSEDSLTISINEQERSIHVFRIPAENDNAMIKGADLLLEKEKEDSTFTSIVISRDGAGPAGIFCVLHNALQQLRLDGEVDIFTTVRQMHTRRPEVITELETYERCYQLVSLFLSEDGIYANM